MQGKILINVLNPARYRGYLKKTFRNELILIAKLFFQWRTKLSKKQFLVDVCLEWRCWTEVCCLSQSVLGYLKLPSTMLSKSCNFTPIIKEIIFASINDCIQEFSRFVFQRKVQRRVSTSKRCHFAPIYSFLVNRDFVVVTNLKVVLKRLNTMVNGQILT